MGCYDVFCPLCGGPLNGIYYIPGFEIFYGDDLPPKVKKVSKWMKRVTLLLPNKTIMGTTEVDCASTFSKSGVEYDFWMDVGFKNGVALHDDCWRIAKKYKLSYKNFENKSFKKDMYGFLVKGLDYKVIEKYWAQVFNTDNLLKDKNDYLLDSPLKSKKNAERFINNIKKLMKSKKEIVVKKERPSPADSATKFRVGTKKRGGDGTIWKVKKTASGIRR